MCSHSPALPYSAFELRAMAAALNRAADRLEREARDLDAMLERRRKAHGDDLPAVAATLHRVVGQLRQWAEPVLADGRSAIERGPTASSACARRSPVTVQRRIDILVQRPPRLGRPA